MKTLNSLFVLIIVLSSLMATAQKADSVIVIYDKQKTVIPVPAFGSQTTIKMADSIQIIEIGVMRKKAGGNFPGAVQQADHFISNNKSEKGRKQVKWFSQIEVGYTKSFTGMNFKASYTYTNQDGALITSVTDIESGNTNGFQLRVLIREHQNMLNEKISFNSGLKIGYGRSFSSGFFHSSDYDSTGYMIFSKSQFSDYRLSSFHLSYEVGLGYHFQTFKLPSKIILGNGFNYSISGSKDINNDQWSSIYVTTYTSILHPYISAEIGKFGIMISMDWKISDSAPSIFSNNYGYQRFNNYYRTLTTGLTFRLF
jgi:hypothetical protein